MHLYLYIGLLYKVTISVIRLCGCNTRQCKESRATLIRDPNVDWCSEILAKVIYIVKRPNCILVYGSTSKSGVVKRPNCILVYGSTSKSGVVKRPNCMY